MIHPGFFKEIAFQVMVGNIFGAKYEANAWVYPYILDGTTYEMSGWFPQSPASFLGGITLRL